MAVSVDFEHLIQQHHAALYRFAVSLTRNEVDASDLVQETFCIWATKGHQLADPSKAKSWLFTTLHREFLASRRRFVRFPHHELEEVESELPRVPPSTSPGVDAETLLHCLNQIDEIFRGPIALFYLEDYSYPEIAEILGTPLGTIKSRIARGLAQLQHRLVDDRKRNPTNPANPANRAASRPDFSTQRPSL